MSTSEMIPDKTGRLIDVHSKPRGWKISPYDRDRIYQKFLRAFPDSLERHGILKEFLDHDVQRRALAWFKQQEGAVSAARIYDFVSQAVATEAELLPKNERWDWWVLCSTRNF